MFPVYLIFRRVVIYKLRDYIKSELMFEPSVVIPKGKLMLSGTDIHHDDVEVDGVTNGRRVTRRTKLRRDQEDEQYGKRMSRIYGNQTEKVDIALSGGSASFQQFQ